MDRFDKLMFLTIALCVFAVLVVIGDACTVRDQVWEPVTVEMMIYKPAESHVGTALDSNGRPVTVVSSTSEEWLVAVRDAGGRVVPSSTDRDTWGALRPGSSCRLVHRSGWLGLVRTHRVRL